MRILMLGNSFTFFSDMPQILAALTGWEVASHTRGGAHLSEHLDPQAELGQKTLPALANEKWDVVVLQDHSRAAFECRGEFLESVRGLCPLIRAAGATPLLYATWAYKDGTEHLASTGMTYDEMLRVITEGYHAAAKENDIPVADVGQAFAALAGKLDLYTPDDYHPSQTGSLLIAHVIAEAIRNLTLQSES